MKHIFAVTFLLFASSINAQKIGVQQLEHITQLKSTEEKCNFFYTKKFVKESSNKDPKIKLVKKKFIKRLQEFDEEIILINSDTTTYILQDPNKFINFKQAIELSYKKSNVISAKDEIIYKKKFFIIRLTETETTLENTEKILKSYNFSIYKTLE